MKNWYASLKKTQKIFLYIFCSGAVLFYGVGIIPLAILIYLELGEH